MKCKKIVFTDKGVCWCEEIGDQIEVYDALYRARKGFSELVDENGKTLTWFEAIRRFSVHEPRAWIMFTVYNDLRERGRVIKLGPHSNGFTLYKGGKPYANIFVLEETVEFPVEEIINMLEYSRKMQRETILAVVDKHGDTSYYIIGKFG